MLVGEVQRVRDYARVGVFVVDAGGVQGEVFGLEAGAGWGEVLVVGWKGRRGKGGGGTIDAGRAVSWALVRAFCLEVGLLC